MNDDYVIIKLLSGENVVSEVIGESDLDITLENPLVLESRLKERDGGVYEAISVVPFCPLSLDKTFVLDKSKLLFIKPLNPEYIETYKQLTENEPKQKRQEPKSMKDVEELLDKLEELIGVEEESEDSIELEGNKTLH
jgi:hypothetical protein